MKKILLAFSLLFFVVFAGCKKEEPVVVDDTDCIPENMEGTGAGCGFAHLYHQLNDDETLVLYLDRDEYPSTEQCTSFELDANSSDVVLTLEVGRGDPDSIYFFHCNDVLFSNYADPDIWTLQSGSAQDVHGNRVDFSRNRSLEANGILLRILIYILSGGMGNKLVEWCL